MLSILNQNLLFQLNDLEYELMKPWFKNIRKRTLWKLASRLLYQFIAPAGDVSEYSNSVYYILIWYTWFIDRFT